jgi:DNA-binding transcriptional LysR family regulator
LSDARRILQDVHEAKLRAERIAHGQAGTLRIGIATAVSWHGLVVDFFREFCRRTPDAVLELHHLLSVQQVEDIESGRLDAGFAASLLPLGKNLTHWQLEQDRMVLAVPKVTRSRSEGGFVCVICETCRSSGSLAGSILSSTIS